MDNATGFTLGGYLIVDGVETDSRAWITHHWNTGATLFVEPLDCKEGRDRFLYALRDEGEIIFTGADFSAPVGWTGQEIVSNLMGFLTLQPGDTDDEYFQNYTPRQLDWCATRAEDLSLETMEYEERYAS
jgi:hypothetical protein